MGPQIKRSDYRYREMGRLGKYHWRYSNNDTYVKTRFADASQPIVHTALSGELNRKRPLIDNACVNVVCHGRHIKALLDTGAARSIISKEIYDQLPGNNELRKGDVKNFVAANKNRMRVIGVSTLLIYLGEDKCYVKFHVINGLATDMIIGRDFLVKHQVTMDFKNNEVTYDMPEVLFSAYDVTIPPRSEIKIEVRMQEGRTNCSYTATITPEPNSPMSSLLACRRQVLPINKGRAIINLCNKSNNNMRLGSGTKLTIATVAKPCPGINYVPHTDEEDINPKRPMRSDDEYRNALDNVSFEGSILTPEQQVRFKQMIWPQRQVLSVNGDIGCLKNYEYTIELNEEKVVSAVPYRLSPVARQVMKKHLDDLESQGVICRYISDYSSPCMLVRKPGYEGLPITQAKHRLVLDLRKINSLAKRQSYQIPHIAETLSQMQESKMKFVSVIDLTKGFNKIPLSKKSWRYTGFKTDGLGSYAQKRLPQGFVNSGEIFQSIMERLIPDELKIYCYIYMDDLAILTGTFEKHLDLLQQVLCALKDNGLTVQIEKSKFCQKEVKFLGYVISSEGIKVRPEKN